ncbi:MAG: ACT domain-containing protein [Saprospiraceae bacterium]|nr:ACT domain-containing protein [Saprospiraceae bacterium]
MPNGEMNLSILIKNMQPILNDGLYVFLCVPHLDNLDFDELLLVFKEKEGTTVVVTQYYADRLGFAYSSTFAWISLHVHSALEAVGLTAAFATALGKADISCNVVAAFYHDHIFVPHHQAQKALETLQQLAQSAASLSQD